MTGKMIRKLHDNEQGNALVFTFAIMIILGLVIALYMQRSDTESKQSARSKESAAALNYAEAGANDLLWRLNNISDFDASADYPKTYNNREGEGIYQINVTEDAGLYTVTSTGGFPLNDTLLNSSKPQRTVKVRIRLANFAEYSRFVDGNIGYGGGARLRGKLHANGNIYFGSTNIILYKDVTCTGSFTGSTPDYRASHTSGVASRSLPPNTLELRALARGEITGYGKGLYFESAQDIDLGNIASLLPDDSTPIANSTIPTNFNGVIYVNNNVTVSGTPDQGITISANGDILIDDHIRYPQDEFGVTLNATIGLVARHQMLIDDTADGNRNSELIIESALMALNLDASNQPTSVTGWRALGNNSGYTLTIDGSIITANGGSSGGYSTRNYNWNEKYSIYTPPYFPAEIGGNYEPIAWDEIR